MNDRELLQEFVTRRSQDAFRLLVTRHLPMVYSAAQRIVRDPQLAEEVAQSVFTTLAAKAASVRPPQVLGGWLYNTTRNLALNTARAEQRRRAREQTAVAMQLLDSHASPADETRFNEHLEPAMADLGDEDRDALVLRYFEDRSLREVGAELGISEDAARMRVNRALERLRSEFSRRGTTVTVGALAAALGASTSAIPVGLSSLIAGTALATLGGSITASLSGTAAVFGRVLQFFAGKIAIGLTVSALVGTGAYLLLRPGNVATKPATAPDAAASAAAPGGVQPTAGAATPGAAPEELGDPDPRKLLQGVARARRRVSSGTMELQFSTDVFRPGRKDTKQPQLTIAFDGPKLRFESHQREYAYVDLASDDSPEAKERVRRADSMDHESAVKAGLLKPFESHTILASDGTTLCRYRESNGTGGSTTIEDPAKASARSADYFFDPRCLGLGTLLSSGGTVEGYLAYDGAKSIKLLGQEAIEGNLAWHIEVVTKSDATLGFWIDAAHPDRVLKMAHDGDSAVSKYDPTNLRDPLPLEVTAVGFYRNQPLSTQTHITRANARLNVPIDPDSFTIAGLGMPIGTPVTDIRAYRNPDNKTYTGLGYWTGSGLAEFPPPKGAAPPKVRQLPELLALLDMDPSSAEALDAAIWIVRNTADGPDVEKAGDALLQYHVRATNLVELCRDLERLRHRCSRPLLEAILSENPSAAVRGPACFELAKWRKGEARFGRDAKATAEAESLFERVISDFGQVKYQGWRLEQLARPELSELRRLSIGKPAPEIEGEDLNGQPIKLSDHRGRVVALIFWSSLYIEAPEHRKLAERLAGQPFSLLGVCSEDNLEKAKRELEKYGVTWPSFRDDQDGLIRKNWNVNSYPNIWVLDRSGTIRYRDVRGPDLTKAVEELLRE